MALTRRARRRLTLLAISVVVLVGLASGAWFVQQSIKDARAVEARRVGLAAAAEGDWETALPNLSLAMSRNQDDLEALLVFAEARSRVPEANNRHLAAAMNLYTRATELAARPGVTEDVQRQALGGRARMELANRAIVRLEETSQEILDLDPTDREALDYLFEIKKIRGEYLPDSSDLIVRGDRTDVSWLQALRDAEARAALRWALERLVLDPSNLDRREQVLGILREGGSEDLQLMRDGALRESTMDLVRAWATDSGADDPMPRLLLALEHLRRNEVDEARIAIDDAEAIGITDPALLLRAVTIREALQTPDDLVKARSLLQRAEEAAMSSPAVAMNIAIRHWNAGRTDDAFRVLDAVAEAEANTDAERRMDVVANAALLAVLDARSDAEDRVSTLRDGLAVATLEPEVRELLRQVAEIARVTRIERPTEDDMQAAQTAAAALPTNPLVQTAFGDVLSRAGLQSLANDAWTRAGEMVGQRSLPIGRRVVRGSLDDQSVTEAFRQAVRYAGGTQSLASVMSLIEAWIALEAAGLEAREVEPRFTDYERPLDLVRQVLADVEASGGETAGLLPLLAETGIRAGEPSNARDAIDRAIRDETPTPVLLRLAGIDQANDLGRADAILDRLRQQAASDFEQDQIAVLDAARLRRDGRADEALALIRARFGDRTDDDGRRFLGLELLDHAVATNGPIDEAVAILVDVPTSERVLRRVQRVAIARGASEASLAVVDRARTQHGADSVPTILAEAEHVLGFESDDPDSVRRAILRADPLVSAGTGGADLEMGLVRLLQMSEPPQTARALDVLRESVRVRPGRFDTAVLLIDLLQQAGRFDEAAEQVQALYRRRSAAPPEIQRLIPTLIAGQGDERLVAESACELAARTGRPLDRLECVRARYAAGDQTEADAMLDELLAEPGHPFAVDIDAAARLVRRGDQDGAITLLRGSTAFPTDLRRDLALAGLLLQLERWADLSAVLDELGSEGEQSAEAGLIRALLQLNGPDRDPSAARLTLDRAIELAPADAGVLRRNATIRLSDPELRESARDAIDLLATIRGNEAELMRLAFDASPDGNRFTPAPEHVVRALALVRAQPTSRPAWVLALEILTAAYEQAFTDMDVTASTRLAEQLVEVAEGAVGRFPADTAFPAQLSQIHLALGDEADALAAAREGLLRAGDAARLGNAIPVAFVELRMGRPEAAVRTLEPFRGEIESGADARPRGWEILFGSLLRIGRVDEAWSVFEARRSARESGGLVPWLVNAEQTEPAVARAAVERAMATLPPGPARLPVVGALVSVYRRTGDASVRATIESMLDEIGAGQVNPALAMQLAFSRLGLDDQSDPAGTISGYAALVDGLPTGTVDRLKRFESLTQAERAEVAPIANVAIMSLNNFAAVTASAALDGRIEPSVAAPMLERAARVADDLGAIVGDSPEVLDTRALVALALGQGAKAADLTRTAIRSAPQRAGFRFTLARALRLEGRNEEAAVQAREALRLHRREDLPDEDAIAEIQRFLESVQG